MTPSEPKKNLQELAQAAALSRAEGHLRLLRGGKDPEPAPAPRRPSRAQRRVSAAQHRRQHNRAVQHTCILTRDCVVAGVPIELDEREWHTLHVARGEAECPACPTCQQYAREGRKPGKLPAALREAHLAAWAVRIRYHQNAHGMGALLRFFSGYSLATHQSAGLPDTTASQ